MGRNIQWYMESMDIKSVEQTAIVHRICIVLVNLTLSKSNSLAKHIVERLKTMKILSLCRLHYMYLCFIV